MERYFKKPNGIIIKATPTHDLNSLEERFTECNADGSAMKKTMKKTKPKASTKKDEVDNGK